MPMSRPAVTIAILNYQRKDLLRRCLEAAVAQEYPDLEIIVVDNASTDGSDAMVEREFPGVRLLRLETNIGCAARNAGVEAARGDIVLTIDNDVLLGSPTDVATAVDVFVRHASAACVNFKIVGADGRLLRRDWCHPRDAAQWADAEFLTDYVLEGASAHRRTAFLRTGGYWPALFLGHEGWDLGLRLLRDGHDLVYSPRVAVVHLASPEARPSSRIYYTFTRNGIWVALRNYPAPEAASRIVVTLALMAFSAARAGQSRAYVRGVLDAIRGVRAAMASRQTMAGAVAARIKELRRLDLSFWQKVKRHWVERPI